MTSQHLFPSLDGRGIGEGESYNFNHPLLASPIKGEGIIEELAITNTKKLVIRRNLELLL